MPRTKRPVSATRDEPLYDVHSYAMEESVGYLVKHLHQSMLRHIDVHMQRHDLTGLQWGPLLMIAKGKADTALELARVMATDPGAATRMLARLEAKGLISRVRSEQDRRVVHLALTAEGQRVLQHIPSAICDVLNLHLDGFTADELAQLKGALQRMLRNGRKLPDSKEIPL